MRTVKLLAVQTQADCWVWLYEDLDDKRAVTMPHFGGLEETRRSEAV